MRRRLPRKVDWEQASSKLAREVPVRYRSFDRNRPGGFIPAQRKEWLAFASGEPQLLARANVDGALPFISGQVLLAAKELGDDAVLYGVHKKGASLLEDLVAFSPALRRRRVVFDDADAERIARAVRGRSVLIIDDSIHDGETCPKHIRILRGLGAKSVHAYVVLASKEGLARVTKLEVDVKTGLAPVPEKLFMLAFGMLIVPLLGLFRNGALSNRPHRSFKIETPGRDPDDDAYLCLRLLSRIGDFRLLREHPQLDGDEGTVFHGTASLSNDIERELRTKLAPIGELDQAKFRLFLSRIDGSFHLCVCAIVWPIAGSANSKARVTRVCDDLAAWLIDEVEAKLRREIAKCGFRIEDAPSPLTA